MGRHAKIVVRALKRGWWQVIVPSAILGGIVLLGAGNAIAQYTQSPVASPAAISRPQVASVPDVPFHHPVQAVSPVQTVPEYTVVQGDTLSGIAKSHCGNSDKDTALAAGNHISLLSVLPLGKVLVLSC